MKKFLFLMVTLFGMTVSSQAMSYEQARQQALFLADKMAYELNLTEDQYEACYEVNLDYLMGVTGEADLYGDYWTRRNMDLSYILLDWQYQAYLNATYFYRPLYWSAGYWHFGIYAYYPHRHYFYFGRPAFWNVYRGGHAWHNNGGRSWYHGRTYGHFDGKRHGQNDHRGMRDGFNRGDYGRGHDFGGKGGNSKHDRIGQSSTHTTVGNHSGGRRGIGTRNNDTHVNNGQQHGTSVDRGTVNRGNGMRTSGSNQRLEKSSVSGIKRQATERSVGTSQRVERSSGSSTVRSNASSGSSVRSSGSSMGGSRSGGSSMGTRSSGSSMGGSRSSGGSHGGGSSHGGGRR